MHLDADRCYRVAQSRDERFDGWFYIAVRTTGIYCRPSCPAMTPKKTNVDFYPSAAAAQQRGFRACKRCRPDAAPGSPEWDLRGDLVARAMRLIADGVIDREGVDGLSARLGYSTRHLNRLLTEQLGAGPLALARSQRAQTARVLIETTDMSMTDIAFAAGFGSIRQFNDTIRDVFAAPPSELRTRRGAGTATTTSGSVAVRLPVRGPFAGHQLLDFLGRRAVPGVEAWDGDTYERALTLPHGHGIVAVRLADGYVAATFRLADWRDLAPAVGRVRRLLDLDADPIAIDEALVHDPALAPLIAGTPGLRVAGSVDPDETVVRAIVGQQVSVAGARTVTGRIAIAISDELDVDHPTLTHVFPSMEHLASADASHLPMPTARAATLQRVGRLIAGGDLVLDAGIDRADAVQRLLAVKGIGPWTARYVAMRGLGDPDVFLDTDLGVKHALAALDLEPTAAEHWRPWRSYAMHHLWNTL
ncbi:DNA-3-methyladenine glycosylase 2 family protein [Ilumatobacter sp.]|uniref:DNA-3-methyladenine glycosylase 2 family protein n=1 Tax=Ilumatobacter sp. TaxID=1967498 RepID=UPI003AF55396